MKSLHDFLVSPIGDRYNNKKKIGDKELILNSEIFNHQFINRTAKVLSVPIIGQTDVKVGDEVIVHHNVFRRWHDMKGRERNSRSYFSEDKYLVSKDQLFLYKKENEWVSSKGYCFIQPIKDDNIFGEKEKPLVGIVKYSDGTVDVGDLVGFHPNSEFEFVIDGVRLYRVLSNLITIKYDYQGNEEAYNPSWA